MSLEKVTDRGQSKDSEQIPVRVAARFAGRKDIVDKARENPNLEKLERVRSEKSE